MDNKHRIIIHLAVAAILCLTLATNSTATDLIFRDDFVCFDTLEAPFPDRAYWPDVAIDSAGRIAAINKSSFPIDNWTFESFQQFNRYDKYGNLSQPVTMFMPDTIQADSQWVLGSRFCVHSNAGGMSVISGHAMMETSEEYNIENLSFLYDTNGQQVGGTICFGRDITLTGSFLYNYAEGNLSNDGIVGMIWSISPTLPPYGDSMYIRFYDPPADTFSQMVNVFSLPQAITHDYMDRYPRLGIVDDDSFVAAWIGRQSDMGRVFYAVYNADMTPRTIALVAECIDYETGSDCYATYCHWMDMDTESDGDFYIAWDVHYGEYHSSGAGSRVWMRGFNPDGTPKYDPVVVTDTDTLNLTDGKYTRPSITCDSSGNVLVVWSDARNYPGWHAYYDTPRNIYAQKIDPVGNLVGPNYRINNNEGEVHTYGNDSHCDMNDAGQAVILWLNNHYVGSTDRIQAQLMPYHDIGTFVPGDINLNGQGNISDMTMLLEWMFRGGDTLYTFWPRNIIDINGDGHAANISDITYFVNYLFGVPLGPPPHTPDEGIRPALPYDEGGLGSPSATAPETDTPDRRLNDLNQRLDNESRHHINSPPRPPDLEQRPDDQ